MAAGFGQGYGWEKGRIKGIVIPVGSEGKLRLINFQSFDLSCSICRFNSSSLAQPMKFSDIISKVLFVGFRPVQSVMSMPEIRAQ